MSGQTELFPPSLLDAWLAASPEEREAVAAHDLVVLGGPVRRLVFTAEKAGHAEGVEEGRAMPRRRRRGSA